ncbi:styrene monooxygenase/indole monooxygenase family protein [Paenibacillus sp. Soil787]|uniref:styrene monooxygenase/indole monooxygenase family protein n=1 Tax=Paenibacillus sp. Soil787 TaxID=1736411 RepID=UPI0007032D8B|nr:styrene monooxygenase/indole monooxygenase family protein [Paenibacillus sp. Soil787]KRF13574.1 hypothetical protein ASG93_13710 [Paenibacillus sp. Soil787]
MNGNKVAIIGSGIGGLTLAYALAKDSRFQTTMFTYKDAEEIRNGRIPSTQVHFDRLLNTEARFDIPDYGDVYEIKKLEFLVNGQKMFKGNVKNRAVSVDQRIYLSVLLDGLGNKGVDIRKSRISKEYLSDLTDEFDIIVDCTGKIGPIAPFPVCGEIMNTPHTPLRVCSAGFFHGLASDEGNKMSYNIVPGQGELFELSTTTKHGLVRTLFLEAIPGSELDRMKGDKGAEDFAIGLRDILETYFPHIFDRVNRKDFRLVDPMAYIRIAIKPEVRIPYTTVNGTLILGCGDSVVLNDPITGQGANAASYCAEMLYNVLSENIHTKWDGSLGELYWERIKEYMIKMSEWTNAMMGPLSEPFTKFLGMASQNQEIADKFVNMFTNPIEAHEVFFKNG